MGAVLQVDNSADSRNWLFRGNFPGNNGSYAYTELIQDLHKRARDEGNASLPDDFELHVINFNNPTDPDFFLEKSFFYQNPSKGDLTIWPLVEALLPVSSLVLLVPYNSLSLLTLCSLNLLEVKYANFSSKTLISFLSLMNFPSGFRKYMTGSIHSNECPRFCTGTASMDVIEQVKLLVHIT